MSANRSNAVVPQHTSCYCKQSHLPDFSKYIGNISQLPYTSQRRSGGTFRPSLAPPSSSDGPSQTTRHNTLFLTTLSTTFCTTDSMAQGVLKQLRVAQLVINSLILCSSSSSAHSVVSVRFVQVFVFRHVDSQGVVLYI
jgi:hypothetical protein